MATTTLIALEGLYALLVPLLGAVRADTNLHSVLVSAAVQLARVLGKECPVQTRRERRDLRGA
jgi:hypothetical protein